MKTYQVSFNDEDAEWLEEEARQQRRTVEDEIAVAIEQAIERGRHQLHSMPESGSLGLN